jgi:hypothetical protein
VSDIGADARFHRGNAFARDSDALRHGDLLGIDSN